MYILYIHVLLQVINPDLAIEYRIKPQYNMCIKKIKRDKTTVQILCTNIVIWRKKVDCIPLAKLNCSWVTTFES